MTEEMGVQPGQVVAGKYRVTSLLGRGGMGSVWHAEHLQLGSAVALKVLKPEVSRNKNSVQRFIREAKAAALLRSPHVVQIFDYGQDGDVVYMAMELLDGESLHQRLRRATRLPADVCATVMTHVGRAVGRAHEMGIVHRDLKPDNVFLVENDDEIVAKVLDFGIAKADVWGLESTADAPTTQTGALLGTPYYMSPEQATGQKDVDHRADLWALGVMTFECLLGERPYRSDSLGDLVLHICTRKQPVPSERGHVPPGFDAWFARTQARDREERFQSARDLVRELRSILLPGASEASLEASQKRAAASGETAPSLEPGAGAVTPASGTASAPAPVLGETFEPLSAVPATPRRRMLVGAVLGAVAVTAAAWILLGRPPFRDEPAAPPVTGAGVETPRAEPTHEPTSSAPVVTAEAPTASVTASTSASASASAPAHVPPPPPRPRASGALPVKPPPPVDKLGI
jgi:predicted Ser/Thr protein kinase